MKSKILLAAIALSFSTAVLAQENSPLEKQIKNYATKIDSIVTSEKMKMNREIDDLDAKFKNGKINDDEKQIQSKEIAQRYETLINEKVDAEKSDLEEITREAAKNSVMKSSEKGRYSVDVSPTNKSLITYNDNEKKKHPKDHLKSGGLVISGGYLNLTNNAAPFNFFNNSSEIRFGQSSSYNYALKKERQIGKFTSPVFFQYGLGVRADQYDLGRSRVFAQTRDQLFITPFTSGNIKYSQLKTEYLEIPLDINFVLNPKYIEHEGEKYLDGTKNQFRIGVGIYGDLKIGNRIKYRYSNDESSKNIFTQKVENGLNPFLFGAKFSIGYGGLNLYLKKDLTPVFNNSASMDNKNALQIGLELASLNF